MALSITYSECVSVGLGTQNVQLIRRVVLSTVAYNVLQYFFFNFITKKDTILGGKAIEHKIWFDFFIRLLSETCLFLRRIERDMIKNVLWASRQVPPPSTLCRIFNGTRKFSPHILEKFSNIKFRKIPISGNRISSMQKDRQTDRQTFGS